VGGWVWVSWWGVGLCIWVGGVGIIFYNIKHACPVACAALNLHNTNVCGCTHAHM
jgi:hypothetical protein